MHPEILDKSTKPASARGTLSAGGSPPLRGIEVHERPATPADMRQFARDPGPGNPRVTPAGSPEAQAYRQQGIPSPAVAPAAAPRLGMLRQAAGRVSRAAVPAGPLAATLGMIGEGSRVYDTAKAPGSTRLDVAEQAAEGTGKLAAAGVGAKTGAAAGAAVGAWTGPLAPIAVPVGTVVGGLAGGAAGYFGAEKLMEKGRAMLGADPRPAFERVQSPLDMSVASQTPAGTTLPSTGAGAGRGSPADPNRTDVDPTNIGFGAARDFSRELASVPENMPADMRDGVVLKTKDANGGTVYSGRNVGADAQMVDGMGRGMSGGGTVSTVPGMAPGEARAILDRPFDPRSAMNPAQRAQYDAEVASAQAINSATAARGGGRGVTVGDVLRSGMQRRASGIEGQRSATQAQQANVALGMRRQDDSEATSSLTRQQTQLSIESAQKAQALQDEYLAADTDAKRAAIAKKIQALVGKSETPNRFTVIPGGSTIDPASGMVIQRPGMVLDNSTGKLVELGAAGAPAAGRANPYPEGTRLQGPDGKAYVVRDGKPVLE